jgi:hypothetical protein
MVEIEPSSIGRLKNSKRWSKQISKWQPKKYCHQFGDGIFSSNDQFFFWGVIENENSQLPNLVTKILGDPENFNYKNYLTKKNQLLKNYPHRLCRCDNECKLGMSHHFW